MSHISLKKVDASSITAPSTNYVRFFSNLNDGGQIYYVDSSGIPRSVSGYTYSYGIPKTYSELYTLSTSNGFATGSYYLITDFESIYDQPDYYFDGTLKSSLTNKGKPSGWGYQPLLVQAISKNEISIDAYQPSISAGGYSGFPIDKIKYDFTWITTELNRSAKGRIFERIDEYGNRTDYDHRTIRFKRYQGYDRDSLLTGSISSFVCDSGAVGGIGTSFSTEISPSDIIIIDSKSDLGYDIGLKVAGIDNDTTIQVIVDSLYGSGIPPDVNLYYGDGTTTGTKIVPADYTFSGKSYTYWKAAATGVYDQYKEVYFGQSDESDCNTEVFTLTTGTTDNIIGNYSLYGSVNNILVLSNNIFGVDCKSNRIEDNFANNNIDEKFQYNHIATGFARNIVSDNFRYNNISTYVTDIDFVTASHVYATYSCNIFRNSSLNLRLSYFDGSDTLTVTDINV